MTQLVFFLEERSAQAMLQGVLPKIIPAEVTTRYVIFEGKQHLEKELPVRLRAWQHPDAKFVVLRDQDNEDCRKIKSKLDKKCANAGKPDTLVRIACHELESFYLGDLSAVAQAVGPGNIGRQQEKAKFRTPDKLANAHQELKNLAPSYQKVQGSRAIGPCLDIQNNKSQSFNALITGVQRLIGNHYE